MRNIVAIVVLLLVIVGGVLWWWLYAPTHIVASKDQYPGRNFAPSPERYGFEIQSSVPIKAEDGSRLLADIVYPTNLDTGKRAKGPFPVILSQDIYSQKPTTGFSLLSLVPASDLFLAWKYFVPRGYIYVHLNVRGTGGSGGEYDQHGRNTGRDGVVVAYWVADPHNVPGANGTVLLEGCSALGLTQLNTLATLGEEQRLGLRDPRTNPIKAAIPKCVTGDPYRGLFFDNGIPGVIWKSFSGRPSLGARIMIAILGNNLSKLGGLFRPAEVMAGGDQAYHRDFWNVREYATRSNDIYRTGVPILFDVGWGEGAFGPFEMVASLQNASAGRPDFAPMTQAQRTTAKYQVIMGDWAHGGGLDRGIEEAWYQTWTMGVSTGMEKVQTPFHIQELPGGKNSRWVNLHSYPISDSVTRYFLIGKTLSIDAPTQASTQNIAWNSKESLIYTLGAPFKQDMTVAGPSALTVWASSSNANLQLYAELDDVAPDGTITPITHGSVLASRRELDPQRSWTTHSDLAIRPLMKLVDDRPITPNEVFRLDIPLFPALWRLSAGHRLRFELRSQASQQACDRTASFLNAVAPVGCLLPKPMEASLRGGRYRIYQGPEHPTSLNATIVPSASLPTARSGTTPTSRGTVLPLDW